MNQPPQCSTENLQAFLEDKLDESMQAQVLAHLDQCASCRRQIEEHAGSADDWQMIAKAFADCRLDANGNIIDEHSLMESLARPQATDRLSLLRILSPSEDPRAAGRIGPFEITGIIGSGGMGLVLKARDPALDRFVAVKLLAPHLAQSQSARKRFAREARAAAAVIHENVIAIYQVAEWNELPYLVMPYMPDPSLQQRIDSQGRLELESVLSIGMQVARGLAAAHTQGLVHRDVKPANILLAKGTERAIITDFGLARAADDATLTRIGFLAGTPHYMSPEQARGEAVDQKSDLYSLGSLLFAMITGQPPVTHELGSETIEKIASGKVPSLSSHSIWIPPWFVKLVDWLHMPQPGDRPESAALVAQWLEQCLAHCRQPDAQAIPECLLPPPNLSGKRTKVAIIAAICSAACVFAVFAVPAMFADKKTPELVRERAHDRPNPKVEPSQADAQQTDSLQADALQADSPYESDWQGYENQIAKTAYQAVLLQESIDHIWSINPEPITNEPESTNTFIQPPDAR